MHFSCICTYTYTHASYVLPIPMPRALSWKNRFVSSLKSYCRVSVFIHNLITCKLLHITYYKLFSIIYICTLSWSWSCVFMLLEFSRRLLLSLYICFVQANQMWNVEFLKAYYAKYKSVQQNWERPVLLYFHFLKPS